MKFIYIIVILFLCNSCDGQNHKYACNTGTVIEKINKLPEIEKQQKYIYSITNHRHGVSYMVDDEKIDKKEYFRIKTGYNGETHWETYQIFYVDKRTCSLYYYDTVSGNLLTIEQWRNSSNKQKKSSMKDIEFSNLFNEGTTIEFTPTDLNKSDNEIQEFKEKLSLYEEQHPLPEDFETDNLKSLINNETFVNNERYIDNSWLNYFIDKYKINYNLLYSVLELAIEQEDYNAVKIIVDKGCIISKKEIKDAELSLKYFESLKGKIDTEEFYDPSFSQISKIYPYIKSSFLKNHIQDSDGFTNLRKEKNAQSEILEKIKSGETIEVLDNTGDWYLVKTKAGKTGYVHKSKISSNKNHSTSFLLRNHPTFESFSREILAKGEVEILHTTNGWDFVKIDGTTGYMPTEELLQETKEIEKQKNIQKNQRSFLADEEDLKTKNKKGFLGGLFG